MSDVTDPAVGDVVTYRQANGRLVIQQLGDERAWLTAERGVDVSSTR